MFNMVCILELFVSQKDLRSEFRCSFPHNFCFTDYTKAFDCVDHNKLWKILKETGILDHLTCLLRDLYASQEATELDMEQQTALKLGKAYDKAACCHPAYLPYMRITSCKMSSQMTHKVESRLPGEISTT